MKKILGDTLLLKFATTYNPKSALIGQGLDYLEQSLPQEASSIIQGIRGIPEKLKETVTPAEEPAIRTDEELLQALNGLAARAKRMKEELSKKGKPSKSNKDFFMDDDMSVSLGPPYFVPPDMVP